MMEVGGKQHLRGHSERFVESSPIRGDIGLVIVRCEPKVEGGIRRRTRPAMAGADSVADTLERREAKQRRQGNNATSRRVA
jgi:hypothetical protein